MIYVFTGSGKGKTTAALGILLRATGHGMKTCLIQFMKESKSGEIKPLEKLGVEIISSGAGFYKIQGDRTPEAIHKLKAQNALRIAKEKILSGNYDIIVLDEINVAISSGLIAEKDVLDMLKDEKTHMVLTGRDAQEGIIQRADLVSDINEIKHPFLKGTNAQKGLEF